MLKKKNEKIKINAKETAMKRYQSINKRKCSRIYFKLKYESFQIFYYLIKTNHNSDYY